MCSCQSFRFKNLISRGTEIRFPWSRYRWIGREFTVFFYEKNLQKFAYFIKFFKENANKQGFGLEILRIFKKFLCQIVPHQFLRTPMSLSQNPKKKFSIDFLRFFGPKKIFFRIFSEKQAKSLGNYFLIILSNFQLFSAKFAYFFVEKFNFFLIKNF